MLKSKFRVEKTFCLSEREGFIAIIDIFVGKRVLCACVSVWATENRETYDLLAAFHIGFDKLVFRFKGLAILSYPVRIESAGQDLLLIQVSNSFYSPPRGFLHQFLLNVWFIQHVLCFQTVETMREHLRVLRSYR